MNLMCVVPSALTARIPRGPGPALAGPFIERLSARFPLPPLEQRPDIGAAATASLAGEFGSEPPALKLQTNAAFGSPCVQSRWVFALREMLVSEVEGTKDGRSD